MKIHITLLAIVSLLFYSCGSTSKMPTVKLNDYTFETIPNDLDNVGYVFAVDNNRMQIPITMFNLKSIEGTVVLQKKSNTKKITIKALINFLGIPQFAN